jgi:hypothetical protein
MLAQIFSSQQWTPLFGRDGVFVLLVFIIPCIVGALSGVFVPYYGNGGDDDRKCILVFKIIGGVFAALLILAVVLSFLHGTCTPVLAWFGLAFGLVVAASSAYAK